MAVRTAKGSAEQNMNHSLPSTIQPSPEHGSFVEDALKVFSGSVDTIVRDVSSSSWRPHIWTEKDFVHWLAKLAEGIIASKKLEGLHIHLDVPIGRTSPVWEWNMPIKNYLIQAFESNHRGRIDFGIVHEVSQPYFPVIAEVKLPIQLPENWKSRYTHYHDFQKDIERLKFFAETRMSVHAFFLSLDRNPDQRQRVYEELARKNNVQVRQLPEGSLLSDCKAGQVTIVPIYSFP